MFMWEQGGISQVLNYIFLTKAWFFTCISMDASNYRATYVRTFN